MPLLTSVMRGSVSPAAKEIATIVRCGALLASVWSVKASGKLLARLYAGDGYQLRQRLVPLVGLLNGRAGLPKLWSL